MRLNLIPYFDANKDQGETFKLTDIALYIMAINHPNMLVKMLTLDAQYPCKYRSSCIDKDIDIEPLMRNMFYYLVTVKFNLVPS